MSENEVRRWKNLRGKLYSYVVILWWILFAILSIRILQGNIADIEWIAGFGLMGIGTSFTGLIIGADLAYRNLEKAIQLAKTERLDK